MALMKAAVLGASGIGRFHIQWLHKLGVEVVAFLGSSEASVKLTAEKLAASTGFAGRGYWVLDELLAREEPDFVLISTPNHLHYRHTLRCLDAGAHVLCEKPMVWDARLTDAELVRQAEEMVERARRAGKLFALTTQYMALAPEFLRIYTKVRGGPPRFERYSAVLTSKLKPGVPTGHEIWVDLSPHLLSFLIALRPDDPWVPLAYEGDEMSRTGRFRYGQCACQIRVAKVLDGALERWFEIDGFRIEHGGKADETGEFRTFLKYPGGEETIPDVMKLSIERFLRAVRGEGTPFCTDALALKNLRMMLQVGGR